MIPQSTPDAELDDLILFVEKIFSIHVRDEDAKHFSSAGTLKNWLLRNVSNERPQQHATVLLKRLAEEQGRPELAKGLQKQWRPEQILTIIGDIVQRRDRAKAIPEMARFIWLYPSQTWNPRPRRLSYSFLTRWQKFLFGWEINKRVADNGKKTKPVLQRTLRCVRLRCSKCAALLGRAAKSLFSKRDPAKALPELAEFIWREFQRRILTRQNVSQSPEQQVLSLLGEGDLSAQKRVAETPARPTRQMSAAGREK